MGVMFVKPIPGYEEKEIRVGDEKFTIGVPIIVRKAETWEINVNAVGEVATEHGCVEVPFKITAARSIAIQEASRRYREVFKLDATISLTARVKMLAAKVGAST